MRQTILALLLVIAVAASAFMWYSLRGQLGSTATASPVDNPEVAEFRRLLAALKAIKLDTSFFSDPAYKSLVDPAVLISRPAAYGKSNPFIPIGVPVALPKN